ncbi:hypothetical protein [Duganella radicis]|uniref:Integral membrane protein n=1 Tax=Duganella radicis TaxID=551988 RepID=A0A6L6PLI9_9BURK|nr:hypothetical protein [Duganella radicis]MTV39996.1 hypothetical protein [Duganella radicis]
MLEFDKWLARVLLLNSALALGVCLGLLGEPLAGAELYAVFGAALLGFLSAVLCLRRLRWGLWGAGLYYLLQLLSYYPAAGGWHYSVKAGVSVGLVLQFATGTLVLNLVAGALLAATAALSLWRARR